MVIHGQTEKTTGIIPVKVLAFFLLQEFGHTLNLTGEHGDFLAAATLAVAVACYRAGAVASGEDSIC
jgi:hypothetical protein